MSDLAFLAFSVRVMHSLASASYAAMSLCYRYVEPLHMGGKPHLSVSSYTYTRVTFFSSEYAVAPCLLHLSYQAVLSGVFVN